MEKNKVGEYMDKDNNLPIEAEKESLVSDITIEQFKNSLENNPELKDYFQNAINEEINNRYPKKTNDEIKFENQQKELEKAMEEKRQLELQIKYQSMMVENNLPIEILDFVAGKDIESTIFNIERFKNLTDKYIQTGIDKEVRNRFKDCSYIPPGENGWVEDEKKDLWKMLL